MSGESRAFGMNAGRTIVNVPFPPPDPDWTLRTLSCGVGLQCAPSKDLIAQHPLHELTGREQRALTIIEGRAALGWLATHWPGTLPELRRLPRLEPIVDELDAHALLEQALALADTGEPLPSWPLLGRLPSPVVNRRGMADTARRMWGRMPWTSRRQDAYRIYSVPVGGEGGVKNPNLPPPSRPEDEEIEISPNQRAGVPYPEWNFWSEKFLPDHVAVLERKHTLR